VKFLTENERKMNACYYSINLFNQGCKCSEHGMGEEEDKMPGGKVAEDWAL